MTSPPTVVAFDVNETLTDMTALRPRLEQAGAPGHQLEGWFASVLRDGFAVTVAGGLPEFATVAETNLRTVAGLDEDGAAHVMAGFEELPLHPDVEPALRRLREAGLRVVTLTVGAAALTRKVLERHGVADLVERCLSAAEAGRWKPAPEPYRYAADQCGVSVQDVALVAVHPWDIHGARQAGLRAGWVNRTGAPYPGYLTGPDVQGATLVQVADQLVAAGSDGK